MASILVVCTGNICRSPMAAGFLRSALSERMGDRAPAVSSVGVAGRDGDLAHPEAVRAAAERGVDISTHVVRRLTSRHVLGADLVVAMAAEHVLAVIRAAPEAAAKTFTLKELVRLLEAPRRAVDGHARSLAGRVAEAEALRREDPVPTEDMDVIDPLGMPFESYRAVAWELDGWCERLADALAGSARTPAAAGAEGE